MLVVLDVSVDVELNINFPTLQCQRYIISYINRGGGRSFVTVRPKGEGMGPPKGVPKRGSGGSPPGKILKINLKSLILGTFL